MIPNTSFMILVDMVWSLEIIICIDIFTEYNIVWMEIVKINGFPHKVEAITYMNICIFEHSSYAWKYILHI
jgi:hypothetical protein